VNQYHRKKSTTEHAEHAENLLGDFSPNSAHSAVIVVRHRSSIIVYGSPVIRLAR
jgi:hypothetical protein